MIEIKYKGNTIKTENIKIVDLLKDEINNCQAIACRFNNEVKSLNYELTQNGKVELINMSDRDGRRVYIRGLVYILTKAFSELYPNAKTEINYQLSNSMLCEVVDENVTDEMIENINKKVAEIIEKDIPIIKKEMSKSEAKAFYDIEKNEKGRLQIEYGKKDVVSLYYCEDYYNYFYGVMPISTGFAKIYDCLLYTSPSPRD